MPLLAEKLLEDIRGLTDDSAEVDIMWTENWWVKRRAILKELRDNDEGYNET